MFAKEINIVTRYELTDNNIKVGLIFLWQIQSDLYRILKS